MKRGSGCCAVDIYWTTASTSFSDSISYITYLFSEWRIEETVYLLNTVLKDSIAYHWKGNLSESPIHFRYQQNIPPHIFLISRSRALKQSVLQNDI